MTRRFSPISYDDASAELKAIYDDIKREMGLSFVPAWFRCQGGVPRLLAANWAKLQSTLLRGDVPRLLKELIIYNVARERSCRYCTFVHRHMAESELRQSELHGAFTIAENLEDSKLPSSYKTAIRVISRLAEDPLATSDGDIEELREEGFSDGEIQELLAQADLALVLTTVAEISGIDVDRELMDAVYDAPN